MTRPDPRPRAAGASPHQAIRFCRGSDGARLAYAVHGSGPPLVVVSCWLSHLQYDWQSPVWRHFLDDLGEMSTLVRYDERGFGLSDWSVSDFSLEARVADLEAILSVIGLERISLLGMSGGGPVAMTYAALHPERVDRLILYGASPVGSDSPSPTDRELAFRALIQAGWAQEDPIFRRVFTNLFIPEASEEQMGWFDELQRMSTSPENALASRLARQEVQVTELLPRIAAQTLVLHAIGDGAVPFEDGRMAATLIPNARLVALPSRNHILLADEPAWRTFVAEVGGLLAGAEVPGSVALPIASLTSRERAVLRLVADGKSNGEIAEELSLSIRTVERHLSNAYVKLGISGRSARAAAAVSIYRRDAS